MRHPARSVVIASSVAPPPRPRVKAVVVLVGALAALAVGAPRLLRHESGVPTRTAQATALPHTPQPSQTSAVRSAVEALYALTVPAITDRRRFAAAVDRLAAPGATEHVRSVFGKTDPELIAAFRRRPHVLRGAPLGYRIDQYDGRRASIAIWNVAVASAPGQPAQSQWRTLVVDLAWTAQGWRVTHGAGVDGPAPTTRRAELAAAAAGFRSFHHVP
jgi:hypothetical protein